MEAEGTKKAARTAIQKIAGTYNRDVVEIINATVVSVDKTARTCVVTPLSGKSDTTIEDVGLMPERNDGEFKIPKVGSTVGVVTSTFVDPYIVSWSDLDEWYLVIGTTTIDVLNGTIKLGDGSFGGIIKITDLTTKLNLLVSQLQAQLALIATGIIAGGGTYTPGTLSTFTQTDYENENTTHGTN